MPKNKIPRHRSGDRDWTRLTSNERIVLAAIYRGPGRTFEELKIATGLSAGQLSRALKGLQSARRCAPLGVSSVVTRTDVDGSPVGYAVSAQWAATHRVTSRQAA